MDNNVITDNSTSFNSDLGVTVTVDLTNAKVEDGKLLFNIGNGNYTYSIPISQLKNILELINNS